MTQQISYETPNGKETIQRDQAHFTDGVLNAFNNDDDGLRQTATDKVRIPRSRVIRVDEVNDE